MPHDQRNFRNNFSAPPAYDAIYQLLSATQGANTTESYTFDPVGNRLTSLVGSSSYNNSNEMTSSPTATFTYDNNGNMLTKVDSTGTTSYTWDFENRLTSVTLPGTGGTVTFRYDPFGRRIQKSSASGTTDYLYDGPNSLEELDTAGNVLARYTQTQNIDEPLAMLRSGATSYYHADGLGSVTSLSNGAGALAQTYTFDSFGKQTASSGSLTNPFQYTGREFDAETGLYYNRARYYDPAAGRFLGEDPLGFKGSGTNFYAYVHNNPILLNDPLGLCATQKDTADCIARGLQALFPGVTATAGDSIGEVGGHWNFNLQLQFSSYDTANAFRDTYIASANNGFRPPARFGSGPAVHLENLGNQWSVNNGTYSITGTGNIDLYNPDSGLGGIAGHSAIDGIWGHIVQALRSNIDPANCPW